MYGRYVVPIVAVIVLCLLAYVGGQITATKYLLGVVIPYAAVIVFLIGFWAKVLGWARSAVPFRIPTTCGQQQSLDWIEPNRIENPFSKLGVIIRMALEILLFRSLFRNTRMALHKGPDGPKISYSWEIFLWVFALAFHYAFLTVLLRHLRFFTEPVPFLIQIIENVDSFFRIEFTGRPFLQIGMPGFYLSGLVLLAAVTLLFLRRIVSPKIRYISLASDYFPLFVIMGIAVTGIMMRYFTKVDIVGIKGLTMGLVTGAALSNPALDGIGGLFFVHIFLVSLLFAYFPFSKLMHLGGVFLSPTRNMTADTRMRRHENPWNYPVKVHTYEDYENEFREKMIDAGLPVDKKE